MLLKMTKCPFVKVTVIFLANTSGLYFIC